MKGFLKRKWNVIGGTSAPVTGPVLAESHMYAGNQSSVSNLWDEGMHADKNIPTTIQNKYFRSRKTYLQHVSTAYDIGNNFQAHPGWERNDEIKPEV